SISDANGCSAAGEINLIQPTLLSIQLMVSEPDCFTEGLGVVMITAMGGVSPYQYSIDQGPYTSENIFENVTDGIYTLYTWDANDCETSEIIAINIPVAVNVDLGDNQILDIGDTTVVSAIVNVPYTTLTSIFWNGFDSITCSTCLEQIIAPFITTTYSIEVINDDGCKDVDEVTVNVIRNGEIFVPNVFSPNDDGINDVLQIFAGSFVETILEFNIFDRWGNLVFSASNFDPGQNLIEWDGSFKSKPLNPAVYAYQLVAKLKDGSQIIRFGDITLIR
ncbi:MAG TPA: gliding motility-associated C-terminal domain-containing protein, partial [Saprospiraceae bacterium]|nr:gliding motility-associated C-terminal domain-containing protein [Saprospiraceae bacterium]